MSSTAAAAMGATAPDSGAPATPSGAPAAPNRDGGGNGGAETGSAAAAAAAHQEGDRKQGHQHGNFHNYYAFNPAEERTRLLPADLVPRLVASAVGAGGAASAGGAAGADADAPVLSVLDVGCNEGDLSLAMADALRAGGAARVRLLGVDVDEVLISRAADKVTPAGEGGGARGGAGQTDEAAVDAQFRALDCSHPGAFAEITAVAEGWGQPRFHLVTLWSITMWVHLNAGDEGLRALVRGCGNVGDAVIVEPQLWRCYKNARRRCRRLGLPQPPFAGSLSLNNDELIEAEIDRVLREECGFLPAKQLGDTSWKRRVLLYLRH